MKNRKTFGVSLEAAKPRQGRGRGGNYVGGGVDSKETEPLPLPWTVPSGEFWKLLISAHPQLPLLSCCEPGQSRSTWNSQAGWPWSGEMGPTWPGAF